jgi:uncharacterized membrane-anchored protein
MTLHSFTRQSHRWLGLLFTLMSVALWLALGLGFEVPHALYFLPLAPLVLMMLSGLYLFFRPYLRRATV